MATTKIDNPNLFDFSSLNTALQLPTGDTASRPSSPSTGEWRYNNETKYVEYYDSTAWREIDTEALPLADDFPEQNFNTNTYNGTGAAQTIDAKFNEAANFNGSSSQILLPNSLDSALGNNNFSYSFWIEGPMTSTNQIWFSLAQNYFIYIGYFSGAIYISLYNNTFSTSVSITADTWTHIVFVKSSSSGITVYKNGTSVYTSTTAAAKANLGTTGNGQINVIGKYSGGGYQFDGNLDQIRLFNTSLSSTQVSDLYAETTTTASILDYPTGAGCIAAYQLDGNAADLSGTYGGITTNIGYTGLLFQPDFVWIKRRSSVEDNVIFDSVRGVQEQIRSNSSGGQSTKTNALSSFDSNGFTTGNNNALNTNGQTYVAWCWKAGGAPNTNNVAGVGNVPTPGSVKKDGADSTAALTGTIVAKKITANTEAGFSIVQYDGTGTAGTIDHLLGAVPNLILVKRTDSSGNWIVGSTEIDSNSWAKILQLDLPDAETSYPGFNSIAPTTSVFSLGTSNPVNNSSGNYIAYCFADVTGYQKIGSYTGNGSTTGPIVNTGFEPAFLLVKNKDVSKYWYLVDNKRSPANPRNKELYPNRDDAEVTMTSVDFFSNGFQIITSDSGYNTNGENYLYWAIAANVESAPTLAKSFNTTQYVGNRPNSQSISGINFQPSFVFVKLMSASGYGAVLANSVSGAEKFLDSTSTGSEVSASNSLTSFDPSGFSVGSYGNWNGGLSGAGGTMISWNWKATELPAINTQGTINSVVNVNQAAGFSFLKWKGTGAQATLGHGLSSAPELIISKNLSNANNWSVYSSALGLSHTSYPNWLYFNLTSDEQSSGSSVNHPYYQAPSTSLIYQNTGTSESTNVNGDLYISYCFHSVSGYSKVGSYTGNGTSKIIYTTDDGSSGGANGFQPDFVLVKRYDSGSAGNWVIVDSVRGVNYELYPDLTNQNNYDTNGVQSFNSNGFTVGSSYNWNGSAGTYIYLAIKIN